MANHKSAKKRIRQTVVRRDRNRATKSACKTAVRAVRLAATNGDLASAETLLRKAEKVLTTAATKGVYHKKNVSRRVSRLATLVNNLKASSN